MNTTQINISKFDLMAWIAQIKEVDVLQRLLDLKKELETPTALPKAVESSIQLVEISPEMQQVMTILERLDINMFSPAEVMLKLKNIVK